MNSPKVKKRKGKAGKNMNKILFLFIWTQLLLTLTWADLESLTPYGQTEKDNMIQIQEMSSSNSFAVPLDVPFKFTGKIYNKLYLTKNGIVTFDDHHNEDGPLNNIPKPLPLSTAYPLIAAYWTNAQTTQHGNLWFQQTMAETKLDIIKEKVQCLYPKHKDLVAKWAIIVTWENLSFSSYLKKFTNTFQLVLANIDDSSFLLFQYGNLTWSSWQIFNENGTKSAVAGYNGGDGINYTMLPGSTSKNISNIQYNSNVNVSGLWIFQIDQSQELCVQKSFAVALLLAILLSLLIGILIGLLLCWCCQKWKHKMKDYEDLDSETSEPKSRKSSGNVSPEEQHILKAAPVTTTTVYTSHAEVDPQSEPEEAHRKIIILKKH